MIESWGVLTTDIFVQGYLNHIIFGRLVYFLGKYHLILQNWYIIEVNLKVSINVPSLWHCMWVSYHICNIFKLIKNIVLCEMWYRTVSKYPPLDSVIVCLTIPLRMTLRRFGSPPIHTKVYHFPTTDFLPSVSQWRWQVQKNRPTKPVIDFGLEIRRYTKLTKQLILNLNACKIMTIFFKFWNEK